MTREAQREAKVSSKAPAPVREHAYAQLSIPRGTVFLVAEWGALFSALVSGRASGIGDNRARC